MAGPAGSGWALGRAVEAPVGLLEADVVRQLVTVRVELAHLPLRLQGVWVGAWGSEGPHRGVSQPPGRMPAGAPSTRPVPASPQPGIQVAPQPLRHLAALLPGHEGCGTEGQGSGGCELGGHGREQAGFLKAWQEVAGSRWG